MAATATLNIRLPEDLKEHGMPVLEREGMSVSDLVRDLFRELEETQELPEFACQGRFDEAEEIARRRSLLREVAGIISPGVSCGESRQRRNSHAEVGA